MSGNRKATARANGPYKQGAKWRAVLSPPPADGTSRYRTFATERECQEYVDSFREATDNRTVAMAIEAYTAHLARFGGTKVRRPLRKTTLESNRHRLSGMLSSTLGDSLCSVTGTKAKRLYSERIQMVRPDTSRGELGVCFSFGRWCVAQGWLRNNPWEGIQAEGERSEGKPVLSVDDSRQYLITCLAEKSNEGLACALLLVLGVRVSELADRKAEDVNLVPVLLNVPKGKTRAAKRLIAVPAPLDQLLAAHVAGKERDASLFGLSRYALYHHVKRLCKAAGVPIVCPHGLRGSAATNIVGAGSSREPDSVQHSAMAAVAAAARLLGHETTTVTRRHYIAPGAIESSEAAAKAVLLNVDLSPGNELETEYVWPFPPSETSVLN